MASPRVWFVTGASSGFGRQLTELALANGDNVVATLRKPPVLDDLKSRYPPARLLVLKLDVTKPLEITQAFAHAQDTFGRIDIVFNNAGYGLLAEVEGTPDETARALFETNFWGSANVSREAVRFFREVNKPGVGGRLLTVSSFVGLSPLPCSGYYSAAKHALEGLTDAFAHELDPVWNIKITLIEPGSFATAALTNAGMIPAHPAYTNPSAPAAQIRKSLESLADHKLGDASKAVKKIYELAALPEPPMRLILGQDGIRYIRAQQQKITSDLEKYESWSTDLLTD